MSILVKEAGFLSTIQDAGRFGYEKFGVPSSGPMDRFALQAANLLVGNRQEEAGLEVGLTDFALVTGDDCLLAAAGAGYQLVINGREMPLWMSIFVRRGSLVRLQKVPGGAWGYLAVSGGINTRPVMGSRATYLKGSLGGANGLPLTDGMLLPTYPQPGAFHELAGRSLPPEARPAYSEAPTIDVIPGPQEDRFTAQGIETFYSSSYRVSRTSDRMGYRLEGPAVEHNAGADILSDGMCFGSVQVPASGQPIVMMSEHPTTGGYTKIATVVSVDLPVLAQCAPGVGQVRFAVTTVEAAQARLRAQSACLTACLAYSQDLLIAYANG